MTEGKGTPTSEQGKDSDKRPPRWKRLWEWTEFGKKSGWNWLELLSALAIPVVLAIFGFWFTAQQDARQQQIENQRAEAERQAHAEARRIIAGLVERIPAIEAPAETPEASETAEAEPQRAEPHPTTAETQEGVQRRPWWRRWFGG